MKRHQMKLHLVSQPHALCMTKIMCAFPTALSQGPQRISRRTAARVQYGTTFLSRTSTTWTPHRSLFRLRTHPTSKNPRWIINCLSTHQDLSPHGLKRALNQDTASSHHPSQQLENKQLRSRKKPILCRQMRMYKTTQSITYKLLLYSQLLTRL